MREVIFKNLISGNSRKKDVVLKEVFERNGIIAKTERRCFYFVKNVIHIEKESDLKKWIEGQESGHTISNRHFHILKEHNDELGEDRVLCKIIGMFYIVVDKNIYTIAFLHSFRMSFARIGIEQ